MDIRPLTKYTHNNTLINIIIIVYISIKNAKYLVLNLKAIINVLWKVKMINCIYIYRVYQEYLTDEITFVLINIFKLFFT